MKTTRREFLTTALAAATLPAEGSSVVADPLGPLNPLPNQRIRFQPTWDSIKQHQVPDWFHDAKLGLFPVWGIYSVPGWAPPAGELGKVDPKVWFHRNPYAEWYWNSMKIKDSPTWQHHVATYGANFKYEDFIPIFI
ncbi:MAG TPA: alpha-L-fucosidase, partial [Terriglobia bacterium]|nr:alpha-L-fucosidase [Terriglobia bacterium]